MSNLNFVRAIDPRIDAGSYDRRTYSVFAGGRTTSYQRIQPDGGVSDSILNFTVNVPSPTVFVNRRPMLEMAFDLTFTGVSAGAGIPLLQCAGASSSTGALLGTQFHDAPRAFPLAQAMSNLTLIINNDSMTQNLNQYIRALPRYSLDAVSEDINYGLTPSMLDQSQDYADLDGFARDPLRGYGDNPLQVPRGGFVGVDIIQNDSTGVADTAVVRITCSEHFFLSPLVFEADAQDCGLYGVNDLQLQIALGGRGNGALAGLVSSLWSHSPASGSVINTAVANVVTANVLFSFITPGIDQVVPPVAFYPYTEPKLYPTQTSVAIAPGALTTIQQNNINIGSIPTSVYLFVSERDQDHDFTKSDTFFGIENVSISFDNRDNLLANATSQDLYNIAKKNNTNISWTQWNSAVGSVLRLDFGEDITLAEDQAVGLRGTFNFRATVQCRNLRGGAVTPTLQCVMISEGVMVIQDQRTSRSVGLFNKEDLAVEMPEVTYHAPGTMMGGNFWQKLRDAGRQGISFIKRYARPAIETARKVVGSVAPQYQGLVDQASDVASAFGLGLVGGRNVSRAELQRMLM